MKLAKIRQYILDNNLSVPIGKKDYYSFDTPLMYRWKDEDTFEVWYENKWQGAESIDWEFFEYNIEEVNKLKGQVNLLIEDYQRRSKTVNEILQSTERLESARQTRLVTKNTIYHQIIADLENLLKP